MGTDRPGDPHPRRKLQPRWFHCGAGCLRGGGDKEGIGRARAAAEGDHLIEQTLEAAQAFLRGEIPLEEINSPIPADERYPSVEAVADPLFTKAHHGIQLAVVLGLLDKQTDNTLLAGWQARMWRP